MKILYLKNTPIFQQLQIEEALLRLSNQNICIINEGSPPAIVMGISGKAEELIYLDQNSLPIIKRFSGGGTVVVDESTLFISFLCQKDLHDFPLYPEPIMRWSEEIYRDVFKGLPFSLQENDYVIDQKKCGGNAQYIRKQRFVHHTTFLWDYKQPHMQLLKHPQKTPKYREGRPHAEFLTKLCEHFPSKQTLLTHFKNVLKKRYQIEEIILRDLLPLLEKPHRKSTEQLLKPCAKNKDMKEWYTHRE